MKSARGSSGTTKNKKSEVALGPVARKAAAGRRELHTDVITAAMQESQRRGSAVAAPKVSAGLMRVVEAAKRQQKKQGIAKEWDQAQRGRGMEEPAQSSSMLGRVIEAADRDRKRRVITRAIEMSPRD